MMPTYQLRKVAVLGAGVMGAQIAAHFANAGVKTILFDLPGSEEDPNSLVKQSIKSLIKHNPPPFVTKEIANSIQAANYEQHLSLLSECDFILEAISERLDWKQSLYEKVAPHLSSQAILATNTSGLSIQALAESLPDQNIRERFLGVHFFNPPRYMRLVELIPHKGTNSNLIEKFGNYLISTLGKSVIVAKDTPNFIGNRIGVFSLLSILHHAEAYKIPPDIVDALTGTLIGRPKSATYRTMDVVGLDTMGHVVQNLQENLGDDPWHTHFKIPDWINTLIEKGALGQKTKGGVYKKVGKEIHVIDTKQGNYRLAQTKLSPEVQALFKAQTPAERVLAWRESALAEGQFLWACFRDLFHYCAYQAETIAYRIQDIDFALRWGYGWQQGPFEFWQAAGIEKVEQWINKDIAAAKSLADVPCESDFSLKQLPHTFQALTKQHYPQIWGDVECDEGKTCFENQDFRLWTLDNEVAIASFKTKKNTINNTVLESLQEAVKVAEKDFNGLVLWQRHGHTFSYGANLKDMMSALEQEQLDDIATMIRLFHQTSMSLRFASVPVIAAVEGLTLGGGCELMLHSAKGVVALESYIGLVEAGVGLLPAGGGTKELARRAANGPGAGLLQRVQHGFETIAMAKLSGSAQEAQQNGLVRDSDVIVMNNLELLHTARHTAQAMYAANYRPPMPQTFPVAGKAGIANLQAMLVNMREGQFISEHDYLIGSTIAHVICGGEIESHSTVTEQYLLDLELEGFMQLLNTAKTQERIQYTLTKGKPLRN